MKKRRTADEVARLLREADRDLVDLVPREDGQVLGHQWSAPQKLVHLK